MKYAYFVVMTVYSFLTGWSYATVAGSAWATNIPFGSSGLKKCAGEAFQHHLIPSDASCVNSYRVCLLFFAIVVITLSMLDLKEQAIVQMTLGMLRFATILAIILYSVVRLAEDENPCEGSYNGTHKNHSVTNPILENLTNVTKFSLANDLLFKFDWKGWVVAIPVFTFAYIVHQGIPALTHPIKQKQYLRWFMVSMFGVTAILYLALGVTVSLYFRGSIQETATLNWVSLSCI